MVNLRKQRLQSNPHKKSHRHRSRQRRRLHPGRSQNNLLEGALLSHLRVLPPDQPLHLSSRQLRLLHRLNPTSPLSTSTSSRPSPDDLTRESSPPADSRMPEMSQGLKLLSRQRKGSRLRPHRLRQVAKIVRG